MPFWDKLFRKKGADPMADEQQNVENTAEDTEVKVDTEAEVKAEAEAQTEGAEDKADNNSEVEALKAKAAETEDKLLRLRADFENFRRRTRQEKEELGNSVEAEFVKNLLPLIDNFERAMAADTTDVETFKKGMIMIQKQLMDALKNKGLEPIEAKDAKFDPNFHQAVMRVENPDLEDDTIAMEMQKGYMVKGKVIRPAMVQVVSN